MANEYVLQGNGIQIDYTIGANPVLAALTFTEGGTTKEFKPAQITTDSTGVGTLVSVALVQTIDTGGTRFGFFCRMCRSHSAIGADYHCRGDREFQRTRQFPTASNLLALRPPSRQGAGGDRPFDRKGSNLTAGSDVAMTGLPGHGTSTTRRLLTGTPLPGTAFDRHTRRSTPEER